MSGIFICYRREARQGGRGVSDPTCRMHFEDAVERAVGPCDVLIALIGPRWLGSTNQAGRRLDDLTLAGSIAAPSGDSPSR